MESLHKNRKSTCTTCNKQIFIHNFASHLQTHLQDVDRRKFKCSVDLCPKKYYYKGDLNQHIKALHSSNPRKKLKCDNCLNDFSSNSNLKRHIRGIHSGSIIKYGCSLCDAVFKSKSGRDYHVVATHTREKAFPCEKCPAKFPTSDQFKCHQFAHSDERPHKCSICSKQFKQKTELRKHVQAVDSHRSKDFESSTCQKTFYTKSELNQHGKIHAIGGEYSCYFCKKEFSRRIHLEIHLSTHTQEKPFICPDKICKYSCTNSSNLQRHQRHAHPSAGDEATPSKIWSCYFCSKTTSQLTNFVIHMRSHTLEEPFPCNLCKKSFKDGSNLRTHISTHTKEKPYSCLHCEKCFSVGGSLKRHVATHTREKTLLF